VRICKSRDDEEPGYRILLLSDFIISVGSLTEALHQKQQTRPDLKVCSRRGLIVAIITGIGLNVAMVVHLLYILQSETLLYLL